MSVSCLLDVRSTSWWTSPLTKLPASLLLRFVGTSLFHSSFLCSHSSNIDYFYSYGVCTAECRVTLVFDYFLDSAYGRSRRSFYDSLALPLLVRIQPAMSEVTNEQLMAALTRLTEFATTQQSLNADLQAKQAQLMTVVAELRNAAPAATDVNEDESKQGALDAATLQADRQRAVHNSRRSVHILNSNFVTGDLMSPNPAPPASSVQTEAERLRRVSGSFNTPARPFTATPAASTKIKAIDALPFVSKDKHSNYNQANTAMSKLDKFYGDKKHDKDIDVYTFVRSIDFQLERWMQGEQFGRLELVISCTAGPAQMWLLNKRDDLAVLLASGQITKEMTEWDYVRKDFIDSMGGGQTQRLYQTKLEAVRLGRGSDSDELTKFITKFRDYAFRAYPLDEYPDTTTRSRLLGQMLERNVRESDFGVWKEMMRVMPKPQTLEDMEEALTSAWSVEQTIRSQRKPYVEYGKGGGKGGNSTTPSPSLMNMDVEKETASGGSRSESETDESLMAAIARKPGDGETRKRTANNKHINGAVAAKLIALRRCLHCYKIGHYARECTTPANRPPTESELKA
jgi:hypothetical protein